MNVVFSLTVPGDDGESPITVGNINLMDEILDLPGLALHRAIRWEVKGLLTDMQPYIIEAVYRAAEREARRAQA